MIIYNQAFDLYHSVYRMLQLLTFLDKNDYVEIDRLRIWDFYFLFPYKIHEIKLKRNEANVRKLITHSISKKRNPYEVVFENRKVFEKIKPYQISALHSLASYGIINKTLLNQNRVSVISKDILNEFSGKLKTLSSNEKSIISIMTSHFYQISMFGKDGLKSRTNLMESKYDAK